MTILDFANGVPPSVRLSLLTNFLKGEGVASPIDMYKRTVGEILAYGTDARLTESSQLGRLLFLGIVSAAEAYFRGILASCIEMCPLCRNEASARQINLGGLLWHGRDGFSRSAFEHMSFASREDLKKATKDYLGFTLRDEDFRSILDEYSVVCNLRHGIVHCDGFLPGRNAVQLDIPRFALPVRIVVGFEQLQSVAAVVGNLVLVLNRELFHLMCRRWAIDWRSRADWIPEEADDMFRLIWDTFRSRLEFGDRSDNDGVARSDCMREVSSVFGL